jgi:DNA gyrase/topoisomerase IV subunit A
MSKVKSVATNQLVEEEYTKYGVAVNENRVIPCTYDGLKPVHRRILYSMWTKNLSPLGHWSKSAKITGDVIGNYHPHGDMAVYQAMVGIANPTDDRLKIVAHNSPITLIYGKGNWGSHDSGAAAQRYTECKLSKFAWNCLLDKELMRVIDYCHNYDQTLLEPISLPAKLPMALIMPINGIGFSIKTDTPSFTIESVKRLVGLYFKGVKITPKILEQTLEFNYATDPEVVEYDNSIFSSGTGSVLLQHRYKIDEKRRQLILTSELPNFDFKKLQDRLLDDKIGGEKSQKENDIKEVKTVYEATTSGDIKFVIEFKPNFKGSIQEWFNKNKKIFQSRQSYNYYMSERVLHVDENGFKEVGVKVLRSNPIKILQEWAEWRKSIETRLINLQISDLESELHKQNLSLFVCTNREEILTILKLNLPSKEEYVRRLINKFKLSADDAEFILGKRLIDITKMNENKIKEKIKDLKDQIKSKKSILSNVTAHLLAEVTNLKIEE